MTRRFDPFTIFDDEDPAWVKIGVASAIILVPSKFVVTELWLWGAAALGTGVLFSLSNFLEDLKHIVLDLYASIEGRPRFLSKSVTSVPEHIVQIFDLNRFIKRTCVNSLCIMFVFLIGGLIWSFGPLLIALLLARLADSG